MLRSGNWWREYCAFSFAGLWVMLMKWNKLVGQNLRFNWGHQTYLLVTKARIVLSRIPGQCDRATGKHGRGIYPPIIKWRVPDWCNEESSRKACHWHVGPSINALNKQLVIPVMDLKVQTEWSFPNTTRASQVRAEVTMWEVYMGTELSPSSFTFIKLHLGFVLIHWAKCLSWFKTVFAITGVPLTAQVTGSEPHNRS